MKAQFAKTMMLMIAASMTREQLLDELQAKMNDYRDGIKESFPEPIMKELFMKVVYAAMLLTSKPVVGDNIEQALAVSEDMDDIRDYMEGKKE